MTSRIVSEISYPSSAAIGGNYSNDDRTLTGENFTVGGDTTITNCDVLLATGTPQDSINLTWDNDATITGTQGSLIFGSMMQAPVMDVATISSGATFPSGHILQVVQTFKTDLEERTTSTSSIDWADIPGMTCSITPKTGNKVLVDARIEVGGREGYMGSMRMMRGSTAIAIGDQGLSAQPRATASWRGFNYMTWPISSLFLDDSPGGDGSTVITYKLQWDGESGGTIHLNKRYDNTNNYYSSRVVSSLTLMEIAG